MELALFGALLIGICLGLLGAGGSIIIVPVLLFILQRPEKVAIAESLAIVAFIASVGAIPYSIRKQIHWKSVLLFGIPGMLGACVGGFCTYYVTSTWQFILFALLMIVAATRMIGDFSALEKYKSPSIQQSPLLIAVEGFLIGWLTGFIGIGGGFIIVPALVLLRNLPMTLAIGTSLVIIAMNAFTGFFEQLHALEALDLSVEWTIIFIMSLTGIVGSLFGALLAKYISQYYLRKTFGFSILTLGIIMLIRQV